jgi:2-polyprenyl-3-methyl-5-hydroxy-6-metoxy-1,4-benzoquinol methylase
MQFCKVKDKMTSIDAQKKSNSLVLKYKLRNATVYQSEEGYTFSKYLDCPDEYLSPVLTGAEQEKLRIYLKTQLESNEERFKSQVKFVNEYCSEGRVLDVGCGGGAFLKKASAAGFVCEGVELERNRAQIARETSGCAVSETSIDSPNFIAIYKDTFDAVTLWDVIEHVNFPAQTLKSVHSILKAGGFVFIDTPAKDSFYHAFGDFTYKLTRGKYPTFLNVMYSEKAFGHKQIFSTSELAGLLEDVGFQIEHIKKFHELSFPTDFYLKKLIRGDYAVMAVNPIAQTALKIFPIRNKMLICAKKVN